MTGAEAMCEYERQRLELIERNKARMKELNLGFMMLSGSFRSKGKATAASKPSMKKAAKPSAPTRQSSRRLSGLSAPADAKIEEGHGSQLDYLSDSEWLAEDDGDEDAAFRGIGRKAKQPREKTYTGEREFVLPPAYDEHGQLLPRRKSCHICTQCIASWRGNFSMPLACTTCPLIFCSRCLFHINGADDIEEAHDFIEEHQGQWSCFVCTETCACQDAALISRGLSRIDRHKARGWVGVTGGNACVTKMPSLRKRKAAGMDPPSFAGGASPGSSDSTQSAAMAAGLSNKDASLTEGDGPPAPAGVAEQPEDSELTHSVVEDAVGCESASLSDVDSASGLAKPSSADEEEPNQEKETEWTGETAVGKRVRAWWPAEGKWFEGTIAKYRKRTNSHTIHYDDGDYEHVSLPDDSIVFL